METKNNYWQQILDIMELIVSSYKARKGDPDAWESTIKKIRGSGPTPPAFKKLDSIYW